MLKPSFSDFYTRKELEGFLVISAALPRDEHGVPLNTGQAHEDWRAWHSEENAIINAALERWLKALSMRGGLQPIPDATMFKRTHRLALAWNALAARKAGAYDLEILARSFNYALFATRAPLLKSGTPQEAYSKLVSGADEGTIGGWENNSNDLCGTTGELVLFELSSWVPSIGTRSRGRDRKLVALRPIVEQDARHPPMLWKVGHDPTRSSPISIRQGGSRVRGGAQHPTSCSLSIREALECVADAVANATDAERLELAPLLQSLAVKPEARMEFVSAVVRLLVPSRG